MKARVWPVLVPLTALSAGLMFATSASTAQGTDLRADRRLQLTELIARERQAVDSRDREAEVLRADVEQLAAQVAAEDSRIGQAGASPQLELAAGLTPVTGPGVTVTLDDAPRRPGRPPLSADPNDLVVHQQDLQAVVNALRGAGAEGIALMGQRIIATSAVRCVGNTVLLHGRVYSPPFVVTAIGNPSSLRDALSGDPGVTYFRSFVDRYGLGYSVRNDKSIVLPAYDGPTELPHVQVIRS